MEVRLTLECPTSGLDWLEVDTGDVAHQLHGLCLQETGILLVPPRSLKEHPLHVDTVLQNNDITLTCERYFYVTKCTFGITNIVIYPHLVCSHFSRTVYIFGLQDMARWKQIQFTKVIFKNMFVLICKTFFNILYIFNHDVLCSNYFVQLSDGIKNNIKKPSKEQCMISNFF